MNTAVILFGQPRGLPLSFNLLEEAILKPNNVKDIFYHFWYDEKDAGRDYNSAQPSQNGSVGKILLGTDSFLLNKLNPKKYVIEPQKQFQHLRSLKSDPSANQEILGSAFYSRMTAYNLCKQYQQDNKIEYDALFCSRIDIFYSHLIKIEDYKEQIKQNNLVVMKKFQDDQDNFNNPDKPMTDMPCIGNDKVMEIYCSAYSKFELLNKECSIPFGENILGRHVRVNNNVQLHKASWDMNILHRVVRQ